MSEAVLIEIALTILRARLRQTIVAAVGVTFGITMFIALLSFMSGLNHLLDGLVINRTPHVRLYKEVEPSKNQPVNISSQYQKNYNFISSVKAANSRQEIYDAGKIIHTILQDTRVEGLSRKALSQVFFNDGAVDITGVMNGIEPDKEVKLYRFGDYIIKGNALDLETVPNSIILGKPLAEKLMADIGDVIQVTTARGDAFKLKVVGFYQSGLADFDKTQSFVLLGTVQKILNQPASYVTDIQVKLHNLALAPSVAKEYSRVFNTNAVDIQTANAEFSTGTQIRNIISYAVGVTLLIVAGFGIYNILNMMIYEKMDTIAILKATGFAGRDVKRIFLFISISIGFFGCMAGLLLGYLLSRLINSLPFTSAAIPTLRTFPVDYSPLYYIIAIIFSFITTYFAGWFPARKASKVDPVVIIRGK
ncbi:MAG TPA: FtsX-like permease family protein [Chitinophagaceae bacterium]|nr:FtsX-like permease family protein [Chitinophagaceae bacterium]